MAEVLKRASVVLKVTSGKGARLEVKWQSNMLDATKAADPDQVLESAAEEIARIAELCGFGDRIERVVAAARYRVREHLRTQQPTDGVKLADSDA